MTKLFEKDDRRPTSDDDLGSMLKIDMTEQWVMRKHQICRNIMVSAHIENYDSRDTKWFGHDFNGLYGGVSLLEAQMARNLSNFNGCEYRVKYYHED